MGLETEYVEYGVELSLAILGLSAVYFIDPSRPVTFLSLLLMPLLYGYTAYISHDGFNRASLVSLSALVFVVVGGFTALIAVFYGIGNVLVSFFSYGTRFKDFYGSTSLPVLIMGALLGISLFAYGSFNPGFQDTLAETAGERSGDIAQEVLPASDLKEKQRRSQLRLVNATVNSTVRIAAREVMNRTERTAELRDAFRESETPVRNQVYTGFRKQMEEQGQDVSSRVESRITHQFEQLSFLLVIPIVTAFFYSLQPLLGILTAISGKVFLLLDG